MAPAICAVRNPASRIMPEWLHSLHNGEFSEVFVGRYENTVFLEGIIEDGAVAGILRPESRPYDIMAEFRERCDRAAPDAGIEEEPRHQEAKAMGKSSMRSWRASREA